ncbi:MAG: hypothetical protein ACJ78Q_09605, partial [Chloroflexia bacterium]
RVFAAAWPLNLSLARRWAAVPLAGLLIFFGVGGYHEYFEHYASLCPYCLSTVQARYAQALGQDYKAYQLGIGPDAIYFTYGSTRFAAKGVEGEDVAVPIDDLPITDNNGKGAAFMIYPSNMQYLPLIRLFYPGGKEEVVKGPDGGDYFTSYKVSREQIAQSQAVNATYQSRGQGSGVRIRLPTPTLRRGTSPAGSGRWATLLRAAGPRPPGSPSPHRPPGRAVSWPLPTASTPSTSPAPPAPAWM